MTERYIVLLSECIHTLVAKDKSQLKRDFSLLLLVLTRRKVLLNISSDLCIAIPYHESWAFDVFERQPVCPAKIDERKAGTVIIDNDNFKDDYLTRGTTSHKTNMIFM